MTAENEPPNPRKACVDPDWWWKLEETDRQAYRIWGSAIRSELFSYLTSTGDSHVVEGIERRAQEIRRKLQPS